jgi:hypothetical protein
MVGAAVVTLGLGLLLTWDAGRFAAWVLIRSYSGVIDPSEGPVDVKVYMATWESHLPFDSIIYLQNKIELRRTTGTVTFVWPDDDAAGTKCEIADFNGDGSMDFAIGTGTWVRVVSYEHGAFRFRGDGPDGLMSFRDMEIVDIDRDGRLEFVVFTHGSLDAIAKEPPNPSVQHWTTDGFKPAPDSLVEMYVKRHDAVRR